MKESDLTDYKILVVDDNLKNIQVIGNILRDAGYKVGYAMDGKQAIEVLHQSEGYDLVLLDINMPDMDGFEVCRAIRCDEKIKELPIIFLTAYSEVESIVKGFATGAQDYITKPFNASELLARANTQIQLKEKTECIRKLNAELEAKVAERTEELKKAYEALNHIDNVKTEFLSFITQEIRTPLNGIVGALNIIKNQDSSSTIKDLLEILDKSVSNLEGFTENATYYASLANAYQLNLTEVNLYDLMQFAIMETNTQTVEGNGSVNVAPGPGNLNVIADKDLVYKAFISILQILTNSFKTNSVNVKMGTEESKLICLFSVEGDGAAVVSLESNQHIKLNLHILKQIMDLHNGGFFIYNDENGGAAIKLIFTK